MPLESLSISRNASREGVNRFQHTRCRALREVTIFDNLAWAFETGEACRAPRGSASPWLSQADSSALLQRCAGLHQAGAAGDPRRAEDIAAEDCGEVRALKVWLFEFDSVASSSSSFSLLESPLGHLGSLGSVGHLVESWHAIFWRWVVYCLGFCTGFRRGGSCLLLRGLGLGARFCSRASGVSPPWLVLGAAAAASRIGAAPLQICSPRGGIRPSLTSAPSILSRSSTSPLISS